MSTSFLKEVKFKRTSKPQWCIHRVSSWSWIARCYLPTNEDWHPNWYKYLVRVSIFGLRGTMGTFVPLESLEKPILLRITYSGKDDTAYELTAFMDLFSAMQKVAQIGYPVTKIKIMSHGFRRG